MTMSSDTVAVSLGLQTWNLPRYPARWPPAWVGISRGTLGWRRGTTTVSVTATVMTSTAMTVTMTNDRCWQ